MSAIICTLTKSDDNWSGDDPPRVCGVQSVTDHPGCSSCDIRRGGCHAHRRLYLLQQSKQWNTRYDLKKSRLIHSVLDESLPQVVHWQCQTWKWSLKRFVMPSSAR